MRRPLLLGLAALLPAESLAQICAARWPDAQIPVPPLVQSFIVAECREFQGIEFGGYLEETLASCVTAEEYGYRAVVTMLTDADTGDQSAGHYRACRVGLGTEGGRFYRRRAECMGYQLDIFWRFEFTRRASAEDEPPAVDFASAAPSCAIRTF